KAKFTIKYDIKIKVKVDNLVDHQAKS
ncbi:MAG: hypothetical protein RLZZ171_159, partial [Cyanobacteriota bacterium]